MKSSTGALWLNSREKLSPTASFKVPLHQNWNVALSVGYRNPADFIRIVLSNDMIDICCPARQLFSKEL